MGFPGGFSVLMAVYAGDDIPLFSKAVESVFANTLQPDAFVLAVDGPVPRELDLLIDNFVKKYGVVRVALPVNNGLAVALNGGLKVIQTEWVVRADADDINVPERFAILAEKVNENPAFDIVGSAIVEMERDGTFVSVRSLPLVHHEITQFARRRNPFNHMTVAFRLSKVVDCGGYPNIYLKEDYALWCKLISAGAVTANVPNILVHANAGLGMFLRRGGVRYVRSEWVLQKFMCTLGVKSLAASVLDFVARSAVFILPSRLRGLVYTKMLRRSA